MGSGEWGVVLADSYGLARGKWGVVNIEIPDSLLPTPYSLIANSLTYCS
jgi:hypothetical protein